MTADRERVLAELPLPLAAEASLEDALAIAVAVEDALGVVLPDEFLTVETLGQQTTIEAALNLLDPPI